MPKVHETEFVMGADGDGTHVDEFGRFTLFMSEAYAVHHLMQDTSYSNRLSIRIRSR